MVSWEHLCSWENLRLAFRKAARGKRGHSPAAGFEHRLEENLIGLQAELESGDYRPGDYHSFIIREPKRRLISAAPFRDRVVHHALCNVIEPCFERSFIDDSYANRKEKGTHRALDRAQQFSRKHRFVLQCDIRQFFPAIDHAVLREILEGKITDSRILQLCGLVLDSGRGVLAEEYDMTWFPGDDLFAATRPRGLPIGNLTSQFWANCFLNPFDHFLKRRLRCPGYLRYVDDFMLFSDSKEQLWEWKAALVERLAAQRLAIHPGAGVKPVTEGLPFLGFTIFPARRRLKRRKGVHFARKYRRLLRGAHSGEIPFETVTSSVRGWTNHVGYANTVGLRKAILGKEFRVPEKQSPENSEDRG